ncbi:MAG: hypothetical protein QM758_04735 [Armatimonas sp.]
MDRRTFLALLLPSATAAAQNPTVPTTPTTLSGILPSARWTPGAAQTLLVIGGKQAKALPEADYDIDEGIYRDYYARLRQETVAQLGPVPTGGYALPAVAAAFGRKVARYGRIATLVPTTKKALVLSPGPPRQDAEAIHVNTLIDRLDDAALKKVLSETGLGRDDLPPSLQTIFDALLPKVQGVEGGKDQPFVPLGREAYQSVRVRVSLRATITALQGERNLGLLVWQGKEVAPGSILPPQGRHLSFASGTILTPRPRTTYGQHLIRLSAPATLPETLPLQGENLSISLEGVSSLSLLVARLAETEGWDIVLSPDLAPWSVEWRGNPEVRTHELLRVVLESTNGTLRQVGNRYVLVDSQSPLGPRLEQLVQWMDRASAQQMAERRREFLPLEWGRFEPSDPCPLPLSWLERLADAGPSGGITVPARELASFTTLQKLIEAHQVVKPEFAPTHLSIRVEWMSYLVFPNIGVFPWEQIFFFGRKRSTPRVAVSLKQTWPILRVTTSEEARSAVSWAKQQGAPGIALEGSNAALSAAIAEKALPVRRVHRLWKAGPTTLDRLRERTIQGQLSDWLSPTEPQARVLATERLKEAALPELDGLLLFDALPPGYRGDGNGQRWLLASGLHRPEPAGFSECPSERHLRYRP